MRSGRTTARIAYATRYTTRWRSRYLEREVARYLLAMLSGATSGLSIQGWEPREEGDGEIVAVEDLMRVRAVEQLADEALWRLSAGKRLAVQWLPLRHEPRMRSHSS
jgi:hypothetical protein